MLVERRVIVDGQGRPLEATETRYAAERYAIDVRFDVEEDSSMPISAAATAR
jgi:GntR family transcriptional regulator